MWRSLKYIYFSLSCMCELHHVHRQCYNCCSVWSGENNLILINEYFVTKEASGTWLALHQGTVPLACLFHWIYFTWHYYFELSNINISLWNDFLWRYYIFLHTVNSHIHFQFTRQSINPPSVLVHLNYRERCLIYRATVV